MNATKRINHYYRREDANPCPYGTFQRATQGHPVRSLNPRLIIRLIRRKLAPESRRNPRVAEVRKNVYCGAIAHWRSEMDMLTRYRM